MADSQRKTANLFDINAKDVNNGYVNNAQLNQDGTTETWASAEISEYIPISGDTVYTFNGIGIYNSPCYGLYDENKQLIGAYKYNGRNTINFTSSNNARYFRFTHIKSYTQAMMIEGAYTSSTMPEFEPYWQHSLRKLTTATDTFTTLPVDVYADGNTATVGLKGNTVQNGTPTPDSPVMPQGTGERTGNLAYGRINDVNISPAGEIETYSGFDIAIARVEAGMVYTTNACVFAFYTNEPTILSVSYNRSRKVGTAGVPNTFTAPITGYVAFRLDSGKQAMLNTGSTLLPYEPYGYKIPISSAGQTTPVYLGEVETTRRVKKLVLTGKETYTRDEPYQRFITSFPDAKIEGLRLTRVFCTHFMSVYDGRPISEVPNNSIYSSDISVDSFFIKTTDYTTAADFKTYLQQQYAAGTPVTVWYVLATEETAVVNEPLMKIGDYADAVSGITIPTITGADSFDVLTTLKPSEASLSYTGWHDATVKEWDGSQWNE